jgi:large subunit ribosomal protein L21
LAKTILTLTFAAPVQTLPGLKFKAMIAVVKVGGQQFKVEKDQTLYVPHLEGKSGDKIELEVLMVDANGKLSVGDDVKTKVKAEILDHVNGDTVIAYKQKRRKGFHKKKGHRTAYTQIKVTSIGSEKTKKEEKEA